MIRRDYLLRMIEEFFEALARIDALKKGEVWKEVNEAIGDEFQKLVGMEPTALLSLTETELLATLIRSGSAHAVLEKSVYLATLLKEAGDSAASQGQEQMAAAYHLKGLNILLGVLARGDAFELPAFVPKIESFVLALGEAALPPETEVLLMQHYESTGQLGKAEDALYHLLETAAPSPQALEFGLSFYRRVSHKSDAELQEGNLPRNELIAGLADFEQKRKEAGPASPK